MANMLKALVFTMAVVGSAVAQPAPAGEAPLALATSPQAVALAADPAVYDALVKAYHPPAEPEAKAYLSPAKPAAKAYHPPAKPAASAAPGEDGRALAGFCEGFVDLYNPECELCNHSGCGWFQCSAFTKWQACKEGWRVCGYESCVGGLCSSKPTCGRQPTSIRGIQGI